MRENFTMLYKRKFYVHHYTEYMDLGIFDEACGMQFNHLCKSALCIEKFKKRVTFCF